MAQKDAIAQQLRSRAYELVPNKAQCGIKFMGAYPLTLDAYST